MIKRVFRLLIVAGLGRYATVKSRRAGLFSNNSAQFAFKSLLELLRQCVYFLVLKRLFRVFEHETHGIGFFAFAEFVRIFEHVEQVYFF